MNWWARQQRRQQELAEGVDADLVRDNWRKSRWGLGLLGSAVALAFALIKLPVRGTLGEVGIDLAIGLMLVAFVLLKWARMESVFLSRPDPEKPPSILKPPE
jgi:hypothetical protein